MTATAASASAALVPQTLTFVDTPGHVAFSHSRFVGAEAADLCLVLCAVDEGPQPQTIDALAAARQFGVPVMPVLTKTDLLVAVEEEGAGAGGGGRGGGGAGTGGEWA